MIGTCTARKIATKTARNGPTNPQPVHRRRCVGVAASGMSGMGLVLRALHELGRDIPGDISIVGFDDMAEASSFWPPLTTIRQDFTAVGRLSMRKLLAKVSGASTENDKTSFPTELIVRSSTAAPPG
jgi:DNA-binding LacI/PurR family transcriptional regulator